jgi:uncharacterized protein YjbI with pentapeptide repeats
MAILPPNDIQAVMDVLRQRKWENETAHQILYFDATNLMKLSLREIHLANASFFGTDLSGADLSGANLENSRLNWATLWMSDLRDANLKRADLTRARLRSDTILDTADVAEAVLTKAELRGVDLSRVKNLTWEQIEQSEALIDCATKLPDALELKKRTVLGCQ